MAKFMDELLPKFADSPEPTLADFKKGTVAWLIQRYIEEMAHLLRPLGKSQTYIVRATGRTFLGEKIAKKLAKGDIKEYAKMRRQQFVKNTKRHVTPQTICQEIGYLRGILKYAASEWDDCDGVSAAPIIDAEPSLKKHNLVGKGTPRDRRPTSEEIATLEGLAHKRNQHKRTRIDLVKLARWQIASGRRVSETTRIEWLGWNPDAQTMVVTKVKDPRRRDKMKVAALTGDAQAMLFELAVEMNAKGPSAWRDPQPRIFPWNPKSASQAYADLKQQAGIKGLRLHDSRGECASRLIEDGYTPTQAILVTLHETTQIFERVYMRLRPENFKNLAKGEQRLER